MEEGDIKNIYPQNIKLKITVSFTFSHRIAMLAPQYFTSLSHDESVLPK